MCEFYNIRHIRYAMKDHYCVLCGQKIEKGSPYFNHATKYEGEFNVMKFHPECHQMVEAYWAENYGEEWDTELVMEFVNEWLKEDGYEPPKLKRDAIKLWLELYGSR